ncbi:hypothetical protein V1514DRAFT_181960 [Lipomyces japonicus]|uniref:uncharacterized protein n=1 Tax=Lipomyces japonicus TaxID=56871 RepID=UPI0034CF7A39
MAPTTRSRRRNEDFAEPSSSLPELLNQTPTFNHRVLRSRSNAKENEDSLTETSQRSSPTRKTRSTKQISLPNAASNSQINFNQQSLDNSVLIPLPMSETRSKGNREISVSPKKRQSPRKAAQSKSLLSTKGRFSLRSKKTLAENVENNIANYEVDDQQIETTIEDFTSNMLFEIENVSQASNSAVGTNIRNQVVSAPELVETSSEAEKQSQQDIDDSGSKNIKISEQKAQHSYIMDLKIDRFDDDIEQERPELQLGERQSGLDLAAKTFNIVSKENHEIGNPIDQCKLEKQQQQKVKDFSSGSHDIDHASLQIILPKNNDNFSKTIEESILNQTAQRPGLSLNISAENTLLNTSVLDTYPVNTLTDLSSEFSSTQVMGSDGPILVENDPAFVTTKVQDPAVVTVSQNPDFSFSNLSITAHDTPTNEKNFSVQIDQVLENNQQLFEYTPKSNEDDGLLDPRLMSTPPVESAPSEMKDPILTKNISCSNPSTPVHGVKDYYNRLSKYNRLRELFSIRHIPSTPSSLAIYSKAYSDSSSEIASDIEDGARTPINNSPEPKKSENPFTDRPTIAPIFQSPLHSDSDNDDQFMDSVESFADIEPEPTQPVNQLSETLINSTADDVPLEVVLVEENEDPFIEPVQNTPSFSSLTDISEMLPEDIIEWEKEQRKQEGYWSLNITPVKSSSTKSTLKTPTSSNQSLSRKWTSPFRFFTSPLKKSPSKPTSVQADVSCTLRSSSSPSNPSLSGSPMASFDSQSSLKLLFNAPTNNGSPLKNVLCAQDFQG